MPVRRPTSYARTMCGVHILLDLAPRDVGLMRVSSSKRKGERSTQRPPLLSDLAPPVFPREQQHSTAGVPEAGDARGVLPRKLRSRVLAAALESDFCTLRQPAFRGPGERKTELECKRTCML